ncbi:MAG: aminotransferase class III-fold pyridoxal phosphate-dependent enzyme, partial [Chloroflexota bacterium]|nr:aminotransferase class III-fold pyridoxal phosphate-dependent enzyme [Chloroflexota bacterium]
SVFEPKGEHGSTFGGNALTSAAAYASTKYVLDNDLCQKAKDDGEYLARALNGMKDRLECVKDIRGLGLLWAIEFQSDLASELYSVCIEDGLLLGLLGPNSIRLMPPLTVELGEIDQAVQSLERGISQVSK